MPGIFPEASSGGMVVRDADGNCLAPAGVANSYCPPAGFITTCEITALPSDCTARITAAQINAFESEMLCFGEMLKPTGTWDCSIVCNLATIFDQWATESYPGSLSDRVAALIPAPPPTIPEAPTDGGLYGRKNAAWALIPGASGSDMTPPGTIIAFAGNIPPTGYIKANGAALSRTIYADLFLAIGTSWGAGDGSTTFNVPDLRGEFMRGFDDGRGVDAGRLFASTQSSAFASHTHAATADLQGAHTHGTGSGTYSRFVCALSSGTPLVQVVPGTGAIGFNIGVPAANILTTDTAGAHTHNITVSAEGSSETRPRNVAPLMCIKY